MHDHLSIAYVACLERRDPVQFVSNSRHFSLAASILGVLVSALSTASAGTYYVAPNGNPAYPGTESQPWNLSKALDAVRPGDTVYLRGGIYSGGALWLKRSGTPGQWITFSAYPGEVPIIKGPGPGNAPKTSGVTDVSPISYVRIEGLWVTGWHYAGISLGWNNPCHHIEFRYNVADLNGQGGLACLKGENCTIEYNIASRNGFGPDSWSSGVNLYEIKGSAHIVRGNISFHNIDTSSNHTDGGGFILDLSKGLGSAMFENNIAFNNGGACIIATDSSGIRLVNNTCWHNGQDASLRYSAAEFHFSDTRRDGKDYALMDVLMVNNVAIAASGHKARSHDVGFQNGKFERNYLYPDTESIAEVYNNPQQADFRPLAKSPLGGAALSTAAPSLDVGFDPKCITRQVRQKFNWWQHAPDIDYIRSIGGIKSCFRPRSRAQGTATTIGAYEFVSDSTKLAVPSTPTEVKLNAESRRDVP